MSAITSTPVREAVERFECFGAECAVLVQGSGPAGGALDAAARAMRRLLAWHDTFSRFDAGSELSRLNRDPRETVPVSPPMISFVSTALRAAEMTDGLVDPTLLAELEYAGYARDIKQAEIPLRDALAQAPPRAAARPSPRARWRQVSFDRRAGTVSRPVGTRLDGGGIVKGLCADLLAIVLAGHDSFAVDAAGDLRFGGRSQLRRPVQVTSPFDSSIVHAFELIDGAAATSGIGKRAWRDASGLPAHHLLDPGTGRPAFTGIVQATALAPTALEAETRSKAALLSGPRLAPGWLVHGGLVVYDDDRMELVEADL